MQRSCSVSVSTQATWSYCYSLLKGVAIMTGSAINSVIISNVTPCWHLSTASFWHADLLITGRLPHAVCVINLRTLSPLRRQLRDNFLKVSPRGSIWVVWMQHRYLMRRANMKTTHWSGTHLRTALLSGLYDMVHVDCKNCKRQRLYYFRFRELNKSR